MQKNGSFIGGRDSKLSGYLAKLNTAFSQSGTNQTAIETRRLEIVELTNRIKGRSDYSNAFTDPQVHLGDFRQIRLMINQLQDYLNRHADELPVNKSSSKYEADYFVPYENKREDSTFFFG